MTSEKEGGRGGSVEYIVYCFKMFCAITGNCLVLEM